MSETTRIATDRDAESRESDAQPEDMVQLVPKPDLRLLAPDDAADRSGDVEDDSN